MWIKHLERAIAIASSLPEHQYAEYSNSKTVTLISSGVCPIENEDEEIQAPHRQVVIYYHFVIIIIL